MATYGDLQSRIATEIKRSGLTTQIQGAIQTAITAYETRPLWFNQQRATMPTVTNQKIYALPSDYKKMRFIRIERTTNIFDPIDELTKGELADWDRSQSLTGIPYKYYVDFAESVAVDTNKSTVGQIWFLPIANGIYDLELNYFRDLGSISQNADENAWTDEGELLIRCRAKRELYTHVIRDTQEALKFASAEQDAYRDLQRRNTGLRAPGRVKANW